MSRYLRMSDPEKLWSDNFIRKISTVVIKKHINKIIKTLIIFDFKMYEKKMQKIIYSIREKNRFVIPIKAEFALPRNPKITIGMISPIVKRKNDVTI